jgi:hypothetical protein
MLPKFWIIHYAAAFLDYSYSYFKNMAELPNNVVWMRCN